MKESKNLNKNEPMQSKEDYYLRVRKNRKRKTSNRNWGEFTKDNIREFKGLGCFIPVQGQAHERIIKSVYGDMKRLVYRMYDEDCSIDKLLKVSLLFNIRGILEQPLMFIEGIIIYNQSFKNIDQKKSYSYLLRRIAWYKQKNEIINGKFFNIREELNVLIFKDRDKAIKILQSLILVWNSFINELVKQNFKYTKSPLFKWYFNNCIFPLKQQYELLLGEFPFDISSIPDKDHIAKNPTDFLTDEGYEVFIKLHQEYSLKNGEPNTKYSEIGRYLETKQYFRNKAPKTKYCEFINKNYGGTMGRIVSKGSLKLHRAFVDFDKILDEK